MRAMARFRFSLRTLVIASLVAGLAMCGWFWYRESTLDSHGTYEFTDLNGNACTVTITSRITNYKVPPGTWPVIFLHSRSESGSASFKYQTYWRHGVGDIRVVTGGIDIFPFYPGNPESSRLLLKDGKWFLSEVHEDYYRSVHEALQDGNESAVWDVLRKGGDPNALNPNGETALHVAIQRNYKYAVQALVRFDADETILNNLGQSATDLPASLEIKNTLSEELMARRYRKTENERTRNP